MLLFRILENLTVISRTRLKSPFDALFDPILDRITQSGVPFALLYPSTRSIPIDIWKAQTEHSKNRCLIVLDGTWDSVKRIAKSPQLRNIPRVSIDLGRPGKYMIRKEPRAECLSTVEAVAECLGVIENDRVVTEALMKPFQQMIAFQLEFIKKGTPKHRPQNAGYVQDLYNDQ